MVTALRGRALDLNDKRTRTHIYMTGGPSARKDGEQPGSLPGGVGGALCAGLHDQRCNFRKDVISEELNAEKKGHAPSGTGSLFLICGICCGRRMTQNWRKHGKILLHHCVLCAKKLFVLPQNNLISTCRPSSVEILTIFKSGAAWAGSAT